MKTPRELILERHQSAEAKLGLIRAADLAACTHATAAPEGRPSRSPAWLPSAITKLWWESIWPWRRVWIGMATVWIVLLALNLTTNHTPKMADHKLRPPSPEVLAAVREQRRLMRQWVEPIAPLTDAHPPIPGPRSEPLQNLLPA